MKETYKVRCPKRIVFGDPQYFEQLKGAKLKSLTVDYKPRSHFTSRVVIEEKPFERFPQRNELTLNIYFAPEDEIETYMENMMYQGQKVTVKNIGIDSPEYCLKIDEQEITMQTDGDGYWGAMHALLSSKHSDESVQLISISGIADNTIIRCLTLISIFALDSTDILVGDTV